ncbi:hypothetical protein BT96DRAFT_992476 [Gymnopus androsaceus JB14]|uniref:Uncharacterized protein n=1 Tax=Gymnopus androsaceus JB14 TaxID=1447944 RepID=A0A6A4HT67_9AGAR|nr:hypothetical protein BT96DRAFT_992476 [Gymnopus androsaceus JB14]
MPSVPLNLGLLAAIWSSIIMVASQFSQFNYQWSFNSVVRVLAKSQDIWICMQRDEVSNPVSGSNGSYYALPLQLQTNCTCSSVYYNALSACAGLSGRRLVNVNEENGIRIAQQPILDIQTPFHLVLQFPTGHFRVSPYIGKCDATAFFNVTEAQLTGGKSFCLPI